MPDIKQPDYIDHYLTLNNTTRYKAIYYIKQNSKVKILTFKLTVATITKGYNGNQPRACRADFKGIVDFNTLIFQNGMYIGTTVPLQIFNLII